MRSILRMFAILLFVSASAFADPPQRSAEGPQGSAASGHIQLAASSAGIVPNEKDPSHTSYCRERSFAARDMMKYWVMHTSKEEFWKRHPIIEATPETKKELTDYVDRAFSHKTDKFPIAAFQDEEWKRCWEGKNWAK